LFDGDWTSNPVGVFACGPRSELRKLLRIACRRRASTRFALNSPKTKRPNYRLVCCVPQLLHCTPLPDALQLELTHWFDLHRVLDLHQHSWTDENLSWLGFVRRAGFGVLGRRPLIGSPLTLERFFIWLRHGGRRAIVACPRSRQNCPFLREPDGFRCRRRRRLLQAK
jgi:hypothetical protein